MSEESEKLAHLAEEATRAREEMSNWREEAIRTKAELSILAGRLGDSSKSFGKARDSTDELGGAFGRSARASNNLTGSFSNLTKAQEENYEAAKKEAEARYLQKASLNQLTSSIKSFSESLITAGGGLSKYNQSISSAGDAVWKFGQSLGPAGMLLGGFVKAATMATAAILKQNDTMMAAKDTLADFGAAGVLTASQLREMGANAGYTREELQKYSKITKSLGTDIIGLSATVSGGVSEFAKLTEGTEEQYRIFRKMGISQEEVTQNQADYVKLQVASGRQITEQMKRDGSLKAASLEYTSNLLQLSAMTGETVAQTKKSIEAAIASEDIKLKTFMMEREAASLRANKNEEGAKAIENEIAMRNKMLQVAEQTKDKDLLAATQSYLATGALTENSKILAVMGLDMAAFSAKLKKGEDVSGEFANALVKSTEKSAENYGAAATFDKELRKITGLSSEMVTFAGKFGGKDYVEEKAKSDAAIKAAAAGKGPPDKVADIIALEEAAGRKARGALDSVVDALNPFTKVTTAGSIAVGALAVAAGLAAAALGKTALSMGLPVLKDRAGKFKEGLKQGPKLPAATTVPSSMPSGPSSPLPQATRTSPILDSTGKPFKIPVATTPPPFVGPAVPESLLAKEASALSKLAGPLTSIAKAAGPVAAAAGVGMAAHGAYTGYSAVEKDVKEGKITKAEGTVKKSEAVGEGIGGAAGGAAGAWAGAAGGAAMGGAIGSVVPILGTAIGAALGGIVGGGLGAWGGGALGGKAGKELGSSAGTALVDAEKEKLKIEIEAINTASELNELSKKEAVLASATIKESNVSLLLTEKSNDALKDFIDQIKESTKVSEIKTEGRVPSQAASIQEAKIIGAATVEGKQDITKNMELMSAALKKQGIVDPKMIAATLGNVMKETGGKSVSENLDYRKTSNERVRKIFGSRVAGKSEEEINEMKSTPEKMGEGMYGSKTKIGRDMGNMEPGDGWKYRGRGFIQLTGKNNYAEASKAIYGDDRLVKDPDLVNNPEVAAECSAWFMKKGKASMARKLGIDTDKMDQAQANLLATSQISGRDVRKMGSYGQELMSKVDKESAKFTTGAPDGTSTAIAAGGKAAPSGTSTATAQRPTPQPPEGEGEGGTAKSSMAKLTDILKFTSNSGSKESFEGLDESLKQSVMAAAQSYKESTGKLIQINSAKRDPEDQKRLYEETVSAGRPGIGPTGDKVAQPGRSLHERGKAVDIQNYNDPAAVAALNAQGLFQKVPKDKVHFQAEFGAVFQGPKSGFPVELHGREAVVPLPSSDSMVTVNEPKATKTPLNTVMETSTSTVQTPNETIIALNELIEILSSKLDTAIKVIEDGNSTREKILTYSMA